MFVIEDHIESLDLLYVKVANILQHYRTVTGKNKKM